MANYAKPKFVKLSLIWADSGYIGNTWHAWFQWFCNWAIEVVKRTDSNSNPKFQVEPRRWVVERTFAWLDRYRRLSKDYEVLNISSETRCEQAMARLMLKRLTAKPHQCCYV